MFKFLKKLNKGFTLVETLVAIVVFTLALGGLAGMIMYSYRSYDHIWDQAVALSEVRKGIRVMSREIREAKMGEDGSYPLAKAGDKEFIFFSDIDGDGSSERVRYFLGGSGSKSSQKQCFSFDDGGSCSVSFSDFLNGDLEDAEVKVDVEGDLGWSVENVDIYADGEFLGTLCSAGCSDCAGHWQGTQTYDVASLAQDGEIVFEADASWWVNDFCDWEEENHSFKARFDLMWQESLEGDGSFKKGVTNSTGHPPTYNLEDEKIITLSRFIRNQPPIFRYHDQDGNLIEEYPARLKDTRVMELYLQVDVLPEVKPDPFDLKTKIYLRNLKWLYEME